MKKLILIFSVCLLASTTLISCPSNSSNSSNESKMKELNQEVNAALEEGDFQKAYNAVDPWFDNHEESTVRNFAYQLNEKILKMEIASYIEDDSDGNMAPKIMFTIKDRAQHNSYSGHSAVIASGKPREEKRMIEYAIELASTNGNDALVEKLKNSMDVNYQGNEGD